ncbi:MAG: MFS transporter [Thermoplasmataceae archaeon]
MTIEATGSEAEPDKGDAGDTHSSLITKNGELRRGWFVSYLLSNVAGGINTPLIPLFVVIYLGYNVSYVGIASALSSLASVPALIYWGNLSDKVGRRKIFVFTGFFGSFVTLLFITIISGVWEYIAVLMVFQIVAMASVPVSTMIILENTAEIKWPPIMSSFNMIASIGTVLGLIFGSILVLGDTAMTGSSLPDIYLVSAVVYLIAALSSLYLLPEPIRKIRRNRVNQLFTVRVIERTRYLPSFIIHVLKEGNGKKKHKLSGSLKKYLFSTTLLMFGFQIFFVPFPVFLIDRFGAGNLEIFIMYLLNSLFSTIAFRPAGMMVNRIGPTKTISTSVLSRIAIFTVAALIPFVITWNLLLLVIMLAFYGVLGGLWSLISISEVTSISKMCERTVRGGVIGMYNSLNGVGQILGAGVSGFLALYFGYSADFLIAAAVVTAGLSIILKIKVPALQGASAQNPLP